VNVLVFAGIALAAVNTGELNSHPGELIRSLKGETPDRIAHTHQDRHIQCDTSGSPKKQIAGSSDSWSHSSLALDPI
jgi:hypothetical protein